MSTGRARAKPAGFTLFEVLIVLVIVALVAAAMVPAIGRGMGAGRAERTGRELAAALRQARGQAIAENRDGGVVIDTDARTFRIAGDAPTTLPDGIELSLVTAANEVREGHEGAIRFYPDGSSTGGEITILDGNALVRVSVDWLTGRVRVEKPASGG